MRLAILTLDFPPAVGGVQTYLYEVARRIGRSHEVYVVTPGTGELKKDVPITKVCPVPRNFIGFWRMLQELKPDRILVGHAHPQLLLPAAVYRQCSYATVTYGNDYLAAQRRWHRPLFNWLLSRSRPLITITQANAQRQLQLGLPNPQVIYPGADHTVFKPPSDRPSSPLVLLSVCRLVPRKGIDSVLKVLPAIRREIPNVRYIVAGTGPDAERLQSIAHELELNVDFIGEVPDEEISRLYHDAHIFVMPSRIEAHGTSIEGFGIVYIEASACGLPVIAGRSGGAVEAVKHGETGFLVDPDDSTELKDALSLLLQSNELRQRFGRNGRQWVEEEMNWDRTARQMQELLMDNE